MSQAVSPLPSAHPVLYLYHWDGIEPGGMSHNVRMYVQVVACTDTVVHSTGYER